MRVNRLNTHQPTAGTSLIAAPPTPASVERVRVAPAYQTDTNSKRPAEFYITGFWLYDTPNIAKGRSRGIYSRPIGAIRRTHMNQRRTFLTPEGLKRFKHELTQLRTVRRPDVASRLHIATESGGTVDNAEYEEVKNEQAFVEGRIRELQDILSNAVVAEKSPDADGVQFGSSVTVQSPDGRRRHYSLVGSAEARPLEGKIANDSPVGEALLDKRVGDVIAVNTPAGVQKLTIIEIE